MDPHMTPADKAAYAAACQALATQATQPRGKGADVKQETKPPGRRGRR